MSLRGIAQQSEAISNGMASTLLPTNDNDHVPNLRSVLIEAITLGIASDAFGMPRNDTLYEYLQ